MVRVLFFLLLVSWSFLANAQMVNNDTIQGNNIIKLNVPSLAFTAINFQYERRISRKQSASLGLIYRINGPVFNYIDRSAGSPIQNLELGAFAVTPEMKFYFDEVFDGLYVGAYGRWRKNQVSYDYQLGITSDALVKVEYTENILHLGGLLGYQTQLSKDVYIDFWFLGIGLSRSNISGVIKDDLGLFNTNHRIDHMFLNLDGIYHRTFSYPLAAAKTNFQGEAWRTSFRGVGVSVGVRF